MRHDTVRSCDWICGSLWAIQSMLEYAMNYNPLFIQEACLLRLRPVCADDCRMIWEWAKMVRNPSVASIHAYIKPENPSSIAMVVAAGYERGGEVVRKGSRALHFVLRGKR